MGYIEIMYSLDIPSLSHPLFCFYKDAATDVFINMWLKEFLLGEFLIFFFNLAETSYLQSKLGVKG